MADEATGANKDTSPVSEETTKIIAQRIKAAREKDRLELAQAMGFDSWDKMLDSGVNKKLLDAGIDPELAKPVFDEIVEKHPDVIRAREVLAEAEKARKEAGIATINANFGTAYKSIDDLDDATKVLVNKGLSVDQAYAAVHYMDFKQPTQDPVKSAVIEKQISLAHLKTVPGGVATGGGDNIEVSQAEIDSVRKYMPNATIDQIKEFKKNHKI